ncbi:acetyltransferase [Streptomyces sp. WM6373]|uniref:GNAT family N-acetyltransferase n=1 Tax=Streptomyces TaxID=1883 RepID=UPI0004C607B4|nr:MULTISPECIES: GNAT family N-acetyltransferase [unclassified Streptomyces]KJY22060.1 acetyltransferase [Streptomyces sp. NRRL S-104]KOU28379.1 acetyltransferase [Streptomyces sp. WM6373]KOU69519.1 acetyltransferase [Streptomyces sp. XY66]KOU81541.1 acetyltransferase [Streptomyces sp. XY58]KOV04662.1 acetyltransferase [Streptomyces sp. XY37]
MASDVVIRPARAEDEREMVELLRSAWSRVSEPGPRRPAGAALFDERHPVEGFLVAERGERIVGYIAQAPASPLETNRHVRHIQGLAVLESARGLGVGRALVEAVCAAARAAGARRMTLRVLGHNEPAQQLYRRCGFAVVGVLPEEFLLDGVYVDDVWMSRSLSDPYGSAQT